MNTKTEFIFGIGSQRAGSTLIHQVLNIHPEVQMHPIKELHYFDTLHGIRQPEVLRRFSIKQLEREMERFKTAPNYALTEKKWRWYVYSNFRLCLSAETLASVPYHELYPEEFITGTYTGETTPEYMLLDEDALRAMYNTIGDARIILLCRNPVQRFLSSFRLLISYNGIQDDNDGHDQRLLAMLRGEDPWIKTQVAFCKYLDAIRRYQNQFSRVMWLYYDDFSGSAPDVLRALSEFLELDFTKPSFHKAMTSRINGVDCRYAPSDEVMGVLSDLIEDEVGELNELAGREISL